MEELSISATQLTQLYFSENQKIHTFVEYTGGNGSPSDVQV